MKDKMTNMWKKGLGMGWFQESQRHSLAAKGIKTGRKSSTSGGLMNIFGLGSSLPVKTVSSKYPVAEGEIGSYSALTLSGIVKPKQYDKVLEYRVWVHPTGGGDDYFEVFKTYEEAKQYEKNVINQGARAEKPLVLVSKGKKLIETVPDSIIGKKLSKEYIYKKPSGVFKVTDFDKNVLGEFKSLKEADKFREKEYKKDEHKSLYIMNKGKIMTQDDYKQLDVKWCK